jgi:NitT/TauT family transport system substrate-binding protein
LKRRWRRVWILLTLAALLLASCGRAAAPAVKSDVVQTLRFGYLANLTHAQALLGLADGSFAKATGLKIVPKIFAAGPEAITALLAGEVDVLYVGPSPAVNGYIKSGGKALRIVAGAASGGAVFVVRPTLDPAHLAGTRLGTPGLGNTQDVALRWYLNSKGLKPREQGGTVQIVPTAPADILTLFGQKQLDGAWVAEPWGARLVHEAGAKVAWDERDLWPDRRFATTVLAVSTPFLEQHRDEVKRLVAQHVELTRWIQAYPDEARAKLQTALTKLQAHALPDAVLTEAFSRIDFVYDPMQGSVQEQADRANTLGLLRDKPNLSGLYDLSLLKEVAP